MSLFRQLLLAPDRRARLEEQIGRARRRTEKVELLRRYRQEAVRDFFRMVAEARDSPPAVDADFARELADAFDAVSQGYAHPLVRPGTKPPGSRTWPALRRNQLSALLYIELAKRGAIADTAPVKTVSDAFGVTRRLLRIWKVGLQDELINAVAAPGPAPYFTVPRLMKRAAVEYRRWRNVDDRIERSIAAPGRHRMTANRKNRR